MQWCCQWWLVIVISIIALIVCACAELFVIDETLHKSQYCRWWCCSLVQKNDVTNAMMLSMVMISKCHFYYCTDCVCMWLNYLCLMKHCINHNIVDGDVVHCCRKMTSQMQWCCQWWWLANVISIIALIVCACAELFVIDKTLHKSQYCRWWCCSLMQKNDVTDAMMLSMVISKCHFYYCTDCVCMCRIICDWWNTA